MYKRSNKQTQSTCCNHVNMLQSLNSHLYKCIFLHNPICSNWADLYLYFSATASVVAKRPQTACGRLSEDSRSLCRVFDSVNDEHDQP